MSTGFIDTIRLGLGYVKPGEQRNKLLFWGNLFIFIFLVILTGLLFTCHNKRNIKSESQDKELLAYSILAAVILGFFALPINIWDGMSYYRKGVYSISKHPIYAFLIALSFLLLFTIGIYYAETGKGEPGQKRLLEGAMFMLGFIIIISYLVFLVVNYPYGWFSQFFDIKNLGDDEMYAINPKLFSEYKGSEQIYYILNKYIKGKNNMYEKDAELLGNLFTDQEKNKLKNNNYDGIDFMSKVLELKNDKKTIMNSTREELYNLGDLKNQYNINVSKLESQIGLSDKDRKKQILDTYLRIINKNRDKKLPKGILSELEEKIKNSTDGRLKPIDYNNIFGYYDNSTGITNLGINSTLEGNKNQLWCAAKNAFYAEFNLEMTYAIPQEDRVFMDSSQTQPFEDTKEKYYSIFDEFVDKNKDFIMRNRPLTTDDDYGNLILKIFTKLKPTLCNNGYDFSTRPFQQNNTDLILTREGTDQEKLDKINDMIDSFKDCLDKVDLSTI